MRMSSYPPKAPKDSLSFPSEHLVYEFLFTKFPNLCFVVEKSSIVAKTPRL